jgi:hypothetical protein
LVRVRVDGVAVVRLDRSLDLVDVLDLVGAGRVGRRRRDRVVAVCPGGQRQAESGDRGDPAASARRTERRALSDANE